MHYQDFYLPVLHHIKLITTNEQFIHIPQIRHIKCHDNGDDDNDEDDDDVD